MKVAYTHDWLYKVAGAEEVLGAMHETLPAPVYTLFYSKKAAHELRVNDVKSSFLNSIPSIQKTYKNFLPLFPLAVYSWNLSNYDVVISSSHAVAKGFKKQKNQTHICYCHTPMRYIWDLYKDYLKNLSIVKKLPFAITAQSLRKWDIETSKNVDLFIANSYFVAKRIKRIYGRDSKVIYPPVNIDLFNPEEEKSDYYVFIGRLYNAYKKVDIVVKAFNKLGKKLIVIGDGEDFNYLKTIAKPNIEFTGWLNHNQIVPILKKAKALVLPSLEDFGIVSVESQACATPVIAYYKGGSRETVIAGRTGLFFFEQSPNAIEETVRKFEKIRSLFNPLDMIKNSERFSINRFKREFKELLLKVVNIKIEQD